MSGIFHPFDPTEIETYHRERSYEKILFWVVLGSGALLLGFVYLTSWMLDKCFAV